MERLNRVIARSGLASRREADRLIAEGRVKINGQVMTALGSQVDPATDRIEVENRPLPRPPKVTYLFYKPRSVICSRERQGGAAIITDFFPRQPMVYPVGRLDKESEGLILVSNDGNLTQRLTHPSFAHRKEYEIMVKWKRQPGIASSPTFALADLERKLRHGVKLGDGVARVDQVRAEAVRPNQLRLVVQIHEGRHHLLRRLCATLGLKVISLKRTRIGSFELDRLRPGQYRLLSTSELALVDEFR